MSDSERLGQSGDSPLLNLARVLEDSAAGREAYERQVDRRVIAEEAWERVEADRDRYREALADIRAELSHGPTANWEYIERRFAEALDA